MTRPNPFDFRSQGTTEGPTTDVTPNAVPGPGWTRAPRPRSTSTGPWIAAAAAAAVAGSLLGGWSLFDSADAFSVGAAFAGWFVAGPMAIGLLAVHSVRLTGARAASFVDVRSTTTVAARRTVLLVAAAGIALAAWRIADWAGRL